MISLAVKRGNGVIADESEIEVAKLLAEDMSVLEMAQKLGIKKKTIESRLERMRVKYGCKSSKGILSIFFRNKLID